jgi:hypothetical protein
VHTSKRGLHFHWGGLTWHNKPNQIEKRGGQLSQLQLNNSNETDEIWFKIIRCSWQKVMYGALLNWNETDIDQFNWMIAQLNWPSTVCLENPKWTSVGQNCSRSSNWWKCREQMKKVKFVLVIPTKINLPWCLTWKQRTQRMWLPHPWWHGGHDRRTWKDDRSSKTKQQLKKQRQHTKGCCDDPRLTSAWSSTVQAIALE